MAGTSNGEGRTELDSHANMCVLGKHCLLLSDLSSTRNVRVDAFAEEAGGLKSVPIVDAMIAYDCPRRNQVYLLILRNVLYIESMDDNLITPFILREAGIIVNDRAKIHCDPGTVTEEDHTIQDRETGLFITMQIRSTFSYFPTRMPFDDDFKDGVVLVITPEGRSWNVYDETFANNERSMTNRKGELRSPMYKDKKFVGKDEHANNNSILLLAKNLV